MHTLKKRELPSNILRYVLLLLGGAVSVMPMIYMISTSLKPNGALYEFPPKFFPALDTVTLENYVYIFSQEKFYVNFLTAWEEFPWALTVLNDTQKRTLPIAISGFFGQHQFTQWGYVFAMSVASLVPVLIVFILCQKYFVSGLQAGGLKG